MRKVEISIEGMSCQHCVVRLKKTLDKVEGILSSEVKIGSATIEFDESQLDESVLKETINRAGYRAVG